MIGEGPGEGLPAAQLRRVLAAAERILSAEMDIHRYATDAPAVLKELLDADAVAYSELDWTSRGFRCNWTEDRPDYQQLLEIYAASIDESYAWVGLPSGRVIGLSDYYSLPRLRDQPAYHDALRHLHVCHNMVFGFAVEGQVHIHFGAYRGPPRDFGDLHRLLVETIKPFLKHAYEAALLRSWRAMAPPDLAKLARFNLTPRQREITMWMLAGKSNDEIGEIVGISAETVKIHLRSAYQRIGVNSRVAATMKILKSPPGFIPAATAVDIGWDGYAGVDRG